MRITTGKFCRKCGAAIPPNSPQQSCGACLLETGLGPADPEREANVELGSSPILMDYGLSYNVPLTPALLRLDPMFDPTPE